MKEEDDDKRLEDIQEWLQNKLRPAGYSSDDWVNDSLTFCVELIQTLKDENESLWLMLDELKASEIEEWGKVNSNKLQDTINERIHYLKWMNEVKGEA